MSNSNEPAAEPADGTPAGIFQPEAPAGEEYPRRVGTVVWGLIVLALAALIIIAGLGVVALNGTYVAIGLMIGSGVALVVGGILSARSRDKNPATRKS